MPSALTVTLVDERSHSRVLDKACKELHSVPRQAFLLERCGSAPKWALKFLGFGFQVSRFQGGSFGPEEKNTLNPGLERAACALPHVEGQKKSHLGVEWEGREGEGGEKERAGPANVL